MEHFFWQKLTSLVHPTSDNMAARVPILHSHMTRRDKTPQRCCSQPHQTPLQTMLHESIIAMFFLRDVVDGSNSASASTQNEPSDDEGVLDEDCDDFASVTSSELQDEEHQEPSSPRPHDKQPSDLEFAPPAFSLPSVMDATNSTPIAPTHPTPKESLLVRNPSSTVICITTR